MRQEPPADPRPAIPADHKPIAQEALYRGIVLPSTWATFHSVRVAVEGRLPANADGPLIIYLTHNAWWDAYMLFLIYYRVLRGGFQNFIMMEEKQLKAFPFFAWCGAFSIDRKRPGDAERSVAYIANRLRERRDRCLWIFPQGKIVPPDRRPIVAYPGLARVVRQCGGATLLPVALRYEFRGEQRPEAFARIGPAHDADGAGDEAELTDAIARRLTETADRLRADLLDEQLTDYRVIMRGRQGIDRMTEGWLRLARRRTGRR